MNGDSTTVRAQGDLQLLPPADLLEVLHRRGFTGRLVLVAAGTPRRVAAVHLDHGRPVMVAGGEGAGTSAADSFSGRQSLIRALTWTAGVFRIESGPRPTAGPTPDHDLGEVDELLSAAREHARAWPGLLRRLPGAFADLRATLLGSAHTLQDSHQQRVVACLERPMTLPELARRTRFDHHVLARTVLDLAEKGVIRLGSASAPAAPEDPTLQPLVAELLGALTGRGGTTLKLTVLSWDARTCFLTVEALLGRFRRPPEDVETQPRYQILHETAPLAEGLELEVLAFRADTFEPVFAAPLVQNCHIFLLVIDLEAGHVWGSERPLADRLNELRTMFQGALVAGRITVGAGAVTDPGSDVIIPEIGRFAGWNEVSSPRFLPQVLREVARRLGLVDDSPGGPAPSPTTPK